MRVRMAKPIGMILKAVEVLVRQTLNDPGSTFFY